MGFAHVSWSLRSLHRSLPVSHPLNQQSKTCTRFRTACTTCSTFWTQRACHFDQMCCSAAPTATASSVMDSRAAPVKNALRAAVRLSLCSSTTTASRKLTTRAPSTDSNTDRKETYTTTRRSQPKSQLKSRKKMWQKPRALINAPLKRRQKKKKLSRRSSMNSIAFHCRPSGTQMALVSIQRRSSRNQMRSGAESESALSSGSVSVSPCSDSTVFARSNSCMAATQW